MLLRTLILKVSGWGWMERFVRRSRLFRPVVRRFIGGDTLADGLATVRPLLDKGFLISLDLLGESVASLKEADAARDAFLDMLDQAAAFDGYRPTEYCDADSPRVQRAESINISIKLTQCGFDLGDAEAESRCRETVERAHTVGTFVRIDMEASDYTDRTLDLMERVFAQRRNTGTVLQTYLYRTPKDLDRLNALGMRVRLVKGAYLEPASVAFPEKAKVDQAYVELAETALQNANYPAFATHDEKLIETIIGLAEKHSVGRDRYEFQMLYGIRRDLQDRLLAEGYLVRVYVPFGSSWYPYFSRRLAERPANIWFIAKSLFRR